MGGISFKQVCDIELSAKYQKIKIKFQLWDTAGEEKYKSLTSVFYRNAHAVIVVFDLSRQETFSSISEWLSCIRDNCSDDVQIILVGNKCDLDRNVDESEIEDLAYLYNLFYTEASAKTAVNIAETFVKLAENLVEQENQLRSLQSIDSGPSSLWLHLQEANTKTPTASHTVIFPAHTGMGHFICSTCHF
ncbi:ras-related protein Rab-8-like [Hydractinia symbiolongicarpus]|uniref:ras-related protein Rab-8-like n=1 Tax=Hydractinia symbiolongicarpus TaxID=13093 RepID=UPI002551AFDF|nr:ras-related protein Rab-8-like [Hydractinia symbiolongicarpus]